MQHTVSRIPRNRNTNTVTAGLALVLLGGCGVNHGSISIAKPKVFTHEQTLASLGRQGTLGVREARGVGAAGINQFSSVRQAISSQLTVQLEQGQVADGYTGPDLPANTAPGLPEAAVGNPESSIYSGLFSEAVQDIGNKEARIESIKLLHEGDHALRQRGAQVFLVRFDLWVAPMRQNYASYLYRVFDFNNGFRNYTKDHDVEFTFRIPTIFDPTNPSGGPLVQVYAVSPVSENITAIDGLSNADSQGLTLGYKSASGEGAQLDYQNDILEQFAELRKYPVTRGVVDSPTQFRYIFSPRRRAEKRSAWTQWMPGLSRYSVSRRLEAGVRTVHALILVRDVPKLRELLRDSNQAKASGVQLLSALGYESNKTFGFIGYEGVTERQENALIEQELQQGITDGSLQSLTATLASTISEEYPFLASVNDVDAAVDELTPSVSEGGVSIPITLFAAYKELGDPKKPQYIPFPNKHYPPRLPGDHRSRGDYADDDRDVRIVRVDLPAKETKPTLSAPYDSKTRIAKISLDVKMSDPALLKGELIDTSDGSTHPTKIEMALWDQDKETGPWDFVVQPGALPAHFLIKITKDGTDWYSKPIASAAKKKSTPKTGLSPSQAFAGQAVSLTVLRQDLGNGTPRKIYFGSKEVPAASVVRALARKTNPSRYVGVVLAPIPADSAHVDVVVEYTDAQGATKRRKIGGFAYLKAENSGHLNNHK